jgi:hypothetical protein
MSHHGPVLYLCIHMHIMAAKLPKSCTKNTVNDFAFDSTSTRRLQRRFKNWHLEKFGNVLANSMHVIVGLANGNV